LTYLALLNPSLSGNLSRADDAMQGLGEQSGSTVDFLEQLVRVLLVALALVTEIDDLYLKVVILVISQRVDDSLFQISLRLLHERGAGASDTD